MTDEQAELRARIELLEGYLADTEEARDVWIAFAKGQETKAKTAEAKVEAGLDLARQWRGRVEIIGDDAVTHVLTSAAEELEATLTEGHPCGHLSTVKGCGGCDPGAVEYVKDDGDPVWRKVGPTGCSQPDGCCTCCGGAGSDHGCQGMCHDCRGTGHPHEQPAPFIVQGGDVLVWATRDVDPPTLIDRDLGETPTDVGCPK